MASEVYIYKISVNEDLSKGVEPSDKITLQPSAEGYSAAYLIFICSGRNQPLIQAS